MGGDDKHQAYSDARLAAIVHSSLDAIVSKDLAGIVETWNAAAERLFGWSAEEMVGESIRRIIPPDRQDEEDAILKRVRAGEMVPKFETIRRTKAGETIPVAVTVSPILDATGTIVGASKIAHDLREQSKLSRELRESQQQFFALAQYIPQLAWMADSEGWIFWYNQRWYDYTGTTLEQMQGWGWKEVHHPDHVERVVERIQRAWDTGEDWEDTFPLRGKDGEYRWFLSRANALRDDKGDVLLWVGTNTDITEQREASERIGLLVDEVNHRARNILATIQAIIRRTLGNRDPALVEALSRRISALSANQELLTALDWTGAHVADLIGAQMLHVVDAKSPRVTLSGPERLLLGPVAAEALGLTIHELATNAAKYGALSVPEGRVEIDWGVRDSEDGPQFEIGWREIGGPPVVKPDRSGFGTIIIRRHPEQVTRGTVSLDYRPDGVVWRLTASAARTLAGGPFGDGEAAGS